MVSTDPVRDTSVWMKEFMGNLTLIFGLLGTPDELAEAVQAFGVPLLHCGGRTRFHLCLWIKKVICAKVFLLFKIEDFAADLKVGDSGKIKHHHISLNLHW